MKAFALTLFAATLIAHFDAYAQTGNESATDTHVITTAHPMWLIERPFPDGQMLVARTLGDSTYGDGDHHVKANLVISCHPRNPEAGLTLEISPQSLGLNSDPFEGKDASANGPLRITMGTRPAVDHLVNGFWYYGGPFQIGLVFALSTSVPRDELTYWASDASRGQTLALSLAPATEGGKPLTASFTLPANNNGLKKAILPCLGPDGAATR
ncbi:hypothetical protein [Pseudomonas costantinii]|uniref:DUF1775 domain-containing protein n=1 Tax=Pseudomonas costantinii TaxID=168469 RepID=A0A1S2V3T4_9PSED|nr:hypothetical protein [Pseudomonas costantinii]NVZ22077.1 hypothetical protein [Pseudomonas costantinii]OIN53299.1 hypothetical protein BFL40_10775 [Pseudomonas costantinii]SEE52421.1 hypothetical protein SAMN04515675_6022 [Pseudomonas costantinii]